MAHKIHKSMHEPAIAAEHTEQLGGKLNLSVTFARVGLCSDYSVEHRGMGSSDTMQISLYRWYKQ